MQRSGNLEGIREGHNREGNNLQKWRGKTLLGREKGEDKVWKEGGKRAGVKRGRKNHSWGEKAEEGRLMPDMATKGGKELSLDHEKSVGRKHSRISMPGWHLIFQKD